MTLEEKKKHLLRFMHTCGFEWICDIAFGPNGQEMGAIKTPDSDLIWWKPLGVKGINFTALFQGSIYAAHISAMEKKVNAMK